MVPLMLRQQLKEQLQIGYQCTETERKQLEEQLLGLSDLSALHDSKFGETDLVAHTLDTGSAKPVQTSPRWLLYLRVGIGTGKCTTHRLYRVK